MKGLLLALTVLSLSPGEWQTPPAAPQDGSIAGTVVSAETGRPIGGARLRLIPFDDRALVRSEVVDAQGHYEFRALLPGRYQLSASADRHITLQYGQRDPADASRPIDLAEAERFSKADFVLPRTSAIEGQVLDEFGDPAPNITIQVARVEFSAGRRRLMPGGSVPVPQATTIRAAGKTTDDKGRFRVSGLPPGDYFIAALSGAFTAQETGGFVPTYYPGTADLASARPIRVGVAQDVTGITFSLVPAPMVRVSGVIVDNSGQPLAGGRVSLAPAEQTGSRALMLAQTTAGADGRFTFRNVPPGYFVLQAVGGGRGGGQFGSLPIAVSGRDIGEVVLRVTPGSTARGQIVFFGDAPRPRPRDIRITVVPVPSDSTPTSNGVVGARVEVDGTFAVGNLYGIRLIRVDAPPGWSLERITYQGRDITDEPIDFSGRSLTGLEIMLTSRAASLSGTVVDRSGRPATNYAVIVYSANAARWTIASRFLHVAQPDQEGRFTVDGLPPETYLAVALQSVAGTEWRDPEFLEKLRFDATPITVGDGDQKTIQLTLSDQR